MSESGSVRRRNPEDDGIQAYVRSSRSEPSLSISDKATSNSRKSEDLDQYAAPINVVFLQVCKHMLVVSLKYAASLVVLLLATSLFALILSYTGVSTIPEQLPRTSDLTEHLLQVIHNFSMGSGKKRHKLRVYRF